MEKFAKFIRVITVSPVMALVLCLLLYFGVVNCFFQSYMLYVCIALLCVGPMLAYPIERIWHPYQKKHAYLSSRQAERELAVYLSIVCYSILVIITFVTYQSAMLKQMVLTFFFSVTLLYLLSVMFKINPSGHLCGVVGPTLFLAYSISPYFLFLFVVIAFTVWSSLKLKRHTILEVVLGAIIPTVSLALAVYII